MDTVNYRRLTGSEIEQLQRQGNRAEDWLQVMVEDPFDAATLHGNVFIGMVKIGATERGFVEDGKIRLPEGVCGSMICDSTVGAHCAVHNVHYMSGYAIGERCLLFNIDEMTATADGEYEWLSPMNENEGRKIIPFGGMTIGDAYLWAKYRDHKGMVSQMERMTLERLATEEGRYGRVGSHSVIKNTRTLHNVTVMSDEETPTKIEDCVALTDGVVGYGCKCEYGCMVTRFLLGEHVHIEMGARLNDMVVGDNSTIARCEVGNSIIFPAHEQHHNNSFLIAAVVMGQSNMAAGCTVGSNHNGRTADNEIVAGRGFWPALCTSLKHSSSFASYCLLAKGAYPSELSVTLPFALVNNNVAKNRLEVMPAYWWMYNMYALNRNITKFAKRDKRKKKAQQIVFTPFAPDTAEEMLNARQLIRYWTEQAYRSAEPTDTEIPVLAYGMEHSKRPVVVLKAAQGYKAYEDMLMYYAMTALTDDGKTEKMPAASMAEGEREKEWVNLGGQLVPQRDVDALMAKIESGEVKSWDEVHECMKRWWAEYPAKCCRHAYKTICELEGCRTIDEAMWSRLLQRYATIKAYVADQVKVTRQKDADNLFRQMTYRNNAEMQAVLE